MVKAIIKRLLGLAAVLCVGACFGLRTTAAVVEADESNQIAATVTGINNEKLDNGDSFVMVLSANDYMTADEWSQANYKWLNAENITSVAARSNIDLSNHNVANAQLDQNLDEYNFEDYIFIDGVSLAEFSQTNSYALIANKRTRPNTISIDFAPGVLSTIDVIEIKAGCQLPTLAYSYLNAGEFSCITVQEDGAYENGNGAWRALFAGYEEGVEYDGGKDNFNLSLEETYKGHTTVPLNAHTDFFQHNAVQGEYLKGNVLVSAANTEKDVLMVLDFINPIDAAQFNRLNLRVYINHQVDVLTYNADSVTEEALGTALESFTVNGGQYTYLALNSPLYANDDGEVDKIVFKFVEDCEPQYNANGDILYDAHGKIIRDTFYFVSFNVENVEGGELVTKDSFIIVDNGNAYDLTFRFNKIGGMEDVALDTEKVTLNGCTISSILAECDEATAEWYPAKGVYQINVSLPKTYTGKAQIKNAEYSFAGNNMSVLEGLVFPNGDVLEKTYTCHLYAGENLLDSELVKNYKPLEVESVRSFFIEDSGNINFSIYFTAPITSSLYNHACEREDWRSSKDVFEIISYDKGSSDIFVEGGYKSSLLDNVVINGLTVGEWHAQNAAALTCVQVFYGAGLELNRMDIRFEAATKSTYDQVYDLVTDGNGVTVEVLSGLRFMTNTITRKTQTFVMKDGAFFEQTERGAVHVYFNGSEVVDGQKITVQTAVSDASIFVEGVDSYDIACMKQGGKQVYTVTCDGDYSVSFTVLEDIIQQKEEGGCSSFVGVNAASAVLLFGAVLIGLKRGGRKHEEK